MADKNILFIDATPDNAAPKEIIECVAKGYGYDLESRTYHQRDAFENDIRNAARPFNILYIAAHGNVDGIALQDRAGNDDQFMNWIDLGTVICEAQGLSEQTTVFLACCDGGFKRAASILMSRCPTINIVAGLPCKLAIQREGLVFHTFLDHLERNSDAERISNAVTTATDHQFNIYMRHEMDAELGMFAQFCPSLWLTAEELAEPDADSLDQEPASAIAAE